MKTEKQKLSADLLNKIIHLVSIEIKARKEKDKLLDQLKELEDDISMEETTNELCNSKSKLTYKRISFSEN